MKCFFQGTYEYKITILFTKPLTHLRKALDYINKLLFFKNKLMFLS